MKNAFKTAAIKHLSPRQKALIRQVIYYFKKKYRQVMALFQVPLNTYFRKEIDPVELLHSVKPHNAEDLKKEYHEKGLDNLAHTFVLYRIIGNDLYPRHKKGQSRENLQFILEHEPALDQCQKLFIINRIVDREEEREMIKLFQRHGQPFMRIPLDQDEYRPVQWDTDSLLEPGYLSSEAFERLKDQDRDRVFAAVYRHKNNYVMNNNGARNAALRDGLNRAKWVLPWDGNCFVTPSAWEQIKEDVTRSPYLKYFVVPMTRVINNAQLLSDDLTPEPVEEPQLIFRCDAAEEFNEDFCYGRRPKVELFWRLGIPGKWDRWKDDPWDQKRRGTSPEARQFGVAGWVARMFSGMEHLEQGHLESFKRRGRVRLQAIISTLQQVDAEIFDVSPGGLTSFREKNLEEEEHAWKLGGNRALSGLIEQLVADADEALQRGPYAVTDKTTLPPSGNKHDYWHPAPYWWPNPRKPGGLPYVRRDGERVPGTRINEPDSEKYDRTRLQRVFDDSTILALAWKFTGEKKYAEHGARILERFFIDPDTRMNPHLNYAQVRMGHQKNRGTSHGIIEMKDMYYFLDAVRMLAAAGALKDEMLNSFKSWLLDYLGWLQNSQQGQKERKAVNNHGTYYDLQVVSMAAFLNERGVVYEALLRAQSRIPQQFAADGSQPGELARKTTAHYCCFNFQGWINLAEIALRWGADFWSFKANSGASLFQGARWLLSHAGEKWPYSQIDEFDYERFYPVWFGIPRNVAELPAGADFPGSKYEVKPKFYPHDGIRPYWNLGSS